MKTEDSQLEKIAGIHHLYILTVFDYLEQNVKRSIFGEIECGFEANSAARGWEPGWESRRFVLF